MGKSFEEIAKMWLESELFGKQYSYRKELENATKHLIRYFGKYDCEQIKGLDVDCFVRFESEHLNPNTGKPFSKRLIKDHINTGNNIYEFALENELIECRNPFLKKHKKIPKNAPVKERTPIDDTQKHFILKVYHRAQVAALVMLYCGLRRGEIIPLEWSDIDFVNKQISITKSVEKIDSNNFRIKSHTKNGTDRFVPIPDNIIPYLKLEKYHSKGNKLIYAQKDGSLHTETSWNKTWRSYQTKLNYHYYCSKMYEIGRIPKAYNAPTGIPTLLNRFTAHQLRHTYCTMLYLAGVDILTTSKLMGHKNVQVTLEIYTHLDEKFKKINISKFNDYISKDTANQIILFNNVI